MKKLFTLYLSAVSLLSFGQTTPTWQQTINANPTVNVTKSPFLKTTKTIKLFSGETGSIFSYKRSATDSSYVILENSGSKTAIQLVSRFGTALNKIDVGRSGSIKAEATRTTGLSLSWTIDTTNGFVIFSDVPAFPGIIYNSDYSANFTARSLIDKGYADATYAGVSSAWKTTGNSGTVDGTNFIGTTDNIPFNIKVNNQKAGRIDNTLENTFWGYQAGNDNTLGIQNTANGFNALEANTTGNYNTAIGYKALFTNTTAQDNSAFGKDALYTNLSGSLNTAIGNSSLYLNSVGERNTAIGYAAGFRSVGDANVFIGYYSGSYETGSNKFFVDNRERTNEADARIKSMIYGVFGATIATQTITINGQFQINEGNQASEKVLTSDANGVATWGNIVSSATYTATITAVANCTVTATAIGHYQRIGNVVTVGVQPTIDATVTLTLTTAEISLPIPSNFTAIDDLSGCGSTQDDGSNGRAIGSVANDNVSYSFTPVSVLNRAHGITFVYTIK